MFSVAFVHPKFDHNVGMIARSSDLFGAEHFFVVNDERVCAHPKTDTSKSMRRLCPPQKFATLQEVLKFERFDKVIGIEWKDDEEFLARAYPSFRYTHPEGNVLYVLGSEDVGLGDEELALCDEFVFIKTVKNWSLNVACAASVILSDRTNQQELALASGL